MPIWHGVVQWVMHSGLLCRQVLGLHRARVGQIARDHGVLGDREGPVRVDGLRLLQAAAWEEGMTILAARGIRTKGGFNGYILFFCGRPMCGSDVATQAPKHTILAYRISLRLA